MAEYDSETVEWWKQREIQNIDEIQRLRLLEIKHLERAIHVCEKRMKLENRVPKDHLSPERQKLARIRNDVRDRYRQTEALLKERTKIDD